jgi:hypothetical protein
VALAGVTLAMVQPHAAFALNVAQPLEFRH